ncbi:hypothetical protein QVD17_31310 [Tagetes erecta]|uniref:Reverse transcriptase zinc-binding domain-containing protein n=1 Tax=Tagetes erecta TaxID=13708 RepID=A0AAD8K799_TARER|nr:hypothetical protein QVD17_31310 [Tagetes erecta]
MNYYAPQGLSDKKILITNPLDFGPIPFRLYNSWLDRPDFKDLILKANHEFSWEGPPESVLTAKLKFFKSVIKRWAKEKKIKEEEEANLLVQEMEKIDKTMEERDLTEEEQWILGECKNNLSELETRKLKDLWQKSRVNWASHGDDNTSYFHGIINGRTGPYLEWIWRWKRSLNTTEEQQLVTCKNFLNQVQITNAPDKWKWRNNSSGAFTVASMRSLLHRPIVTHGFRLQWNNWIPVKVNIFGWRAEMDRIATKDALLMRGIITNSNICPLCGEYNETAAHLLVACYFANMTWHFISSWCKIQPIFAFNIKDILEVHKSIDGSRNKRKVVQGIILTS